MMESRSPQFSANGAFADRKRDGFHKCFCRNSRISFELGLEPEQLVTGEFLRTSTLLLLKLLFFQDLIDSGKVETKFFGEITQGCAILVELTDFSALGQWNQNPFHIAKDFNKTSLFKLFSENFLRVLAVRET